MLEVLMALAVVGLFSLVALLFGVDSRDGNDWRLHGRA